MNMKNNDMCVCGFPEAAHFCEKFRPAKEKPEALEATNKNMDKKLEAVGSSEADWEKEWEDKFCNWALQMVQNTMNPALGWEEATARNNEVIAESKAFIATQIEKAGEKVYKETPDFDELEKAVSEILAEPIEVITYQDLEKSYEMGKKFARTELIETLKKELEMWRVVSGNSYDKKTLDKVLDLLDKTAEK